MLYPMDTLAKRLEDIRRNQPRVTSEVFWRQVEEFRGSTLHQENRSSTLIRANERPSANISAD